MHTIEESSKDLFVQIKQPGRHELRVKGSRFIASAGKVASEEEAKQFLGQIASEFPDATHHCYAWRIGTGRRLKHRFSDNGEPPNTAGLPIYRELENRGLTNVVVVVTRYFGGIKLGAGGLLRAYSKATRELLKECGIEKSFLTETIVFQTAHEFATIVHNLVNNFKAAIKDTQYGEMVTFTVEVRASKLKEFIGRLKDGTNGQVQFVS